jgi:transcriptional regulator with XRE-family HTH domain
METDQERREKLRAFLMYQRSRFSPEEVGLPEVRRRRVPGLRRQEVAELVGVSEDWYRWFESGRPVSVSTRLLAHLSDVLRLNAYDRVMLYRLALPELYRADTVTAVDLPPAVSSNVISVSSPSEIDETRRQFDTAREAFLHHESSDISGVRSRIVGS